MASNPRSQDGNQYMQSWGSYAVTTSEKMQPIRKYWDEYLQKSRPWEGADVSDKLSSLTDLILWCNGEATALNILTEPEWQQFIIEVICTTMQMAEEYQRSVEVQPAWSDRKEPGKAIQLSEMIMLQARKMSKECATKLAVTKNKGAAPVKSLDPLEEMSLEELLAEGKLRGVWCQDRTHKEIIELLIQDQRDPLSAFSEYRRWFLTQGYQSTVEEQLQYLEECFAVAVEEATDQDLLDNPGWHDQCYMVDAERLCLQQFLQLPEEVAAQSAMLGEAEESSCTSCVTPIHQEEPGEIFPFYHLTDEEVQAECCSKMLPPSGLIVMKCPDTAMYSLKEQGADLGVCCDDLKNVLDSDCLVVELPIPNKESDVQPAQDFRDAPGDRLSLHIAAQFTTLGEAKEISCTPIPQKKSGELFPFHNLTDEEFQAECYSKMSPPSGLILMKRSDTNINSLSKLEDDLGVCCDVDKGVLDSDRVPVPENEGDAQPAHVRVEDAFGEGDAAGPGTLHTCTLTAVMESGKTRENVSDSLLQENDDPWNQPTSQGNRESQLLPTMGPYVLAQVQEGKVAFEGEGLVQDQPVQPPSLQPQVRVTVASRQWAFEGEGLVQEQPVIPPSLQPQLRVPEETRKWAFEGTEGRNKMQVLPSFLQPKFNLSLVPGQEPQHATAIVQIVGPLSGERGGETHFVSGATAELQNVPDVHVTNVCLGNAASGMKTPIFYEAQLESQPAFGGYRIPLMASKGFPGTLAPEDCVLGEGRDLGESGVTLLFCCSDMIYAEPWDPGGGKETILNCNDYLN